MPDVLVVCASRDREAELESMIHSVRVTSGAGVAVYLDDDNADLYGEIEGAMVTVGPQVGPCASLNALVHKHPGYKVYVAATDDCQFITRGWDKWITSAADRLGVGLIAPYHASPPALEHIGRSRMDFPCATAGWIEAMGDFCLMTGNPPGPQHFYWDVVLELVAGDRVVYATQDEMEITHGDWLPARDPAPDAVRTMIQIAFHLPGWRKKLEEAHAGNFR